MEKIALASRGDAWYQQCLADLQAKEPAFLAIRETLTEGQQEQLDAYIAACEELEHSKIYIAYELGPKM